MIGNPSLGGQSAVVATYGQTFVGKLVSALVTLGLVAGAVFFFWSFVTGAITWVNSSGDKQAVESARGKVMHAIVGLLILFSIYAILRFINKFFGVTILTLDLHPLVN